MDNAKEITDLGFACALVTMGYEPDMKVRGTQAFFVFPWSTIMEEIEIDYFSHSLPLDARTYQKNLRRLKRQIIEATRA